MKTKKLLPIIAALAMSLVQAEDAKSTEIITICIRRDWILSVTEKGVVSLASVLDADPRSRVHSKAGVVDFEKLKTVILKQSIVATKEDKNSQESITATVSGSAEKRSVPELEIFTILSRAATKWEFPGMNKRLLESIDRKPLLKDKDMQNKALHPMEGAKSETPKE
jgi:hypothetical protein